MARALSQFLRIYDDSGDYYRVQKTYYNTVVTFENVTWSYLPFDADGFVAGQTGDEGGVSVTMPATQEVMDLVDRGIREKWLCELRMFEYSTISGNDGPVGGQNLVASYLGEIVGASGPLESIIIELGSSLSPVGAQWPPRNFTSRLIGVPCKL